MLISPPWMSLSACAEEHVHQWGPPSGVSGAARAPRGGAARKHPQRRPQSLDPAERLRQAVREAPGAQQHGHRPLH